MILYPPIPELNLTSEATNLIGKYNYLFNICASAVIIDNLSGKYNYLLNICASAVIIDNLSGKYNYLFNICASAVIVHNCVGFMRCHNFVGASC